MFTSALRALVATFVPLAENATGLRRKRYSSSFAPIFTSTFQLLKIVLFCNAIRRIASRQTASSGPNLAGIWRMPLMNNLRSALTAWTVPYAMRLSRCMSCLNAYFCESCCSAHPEEHSLECRQVNQWHRGQLLPLYLVYTWRNPFRFKNCKIFLLSFQCSIRL